MSRLDIVAALSNEFDGYLVALDFEKCGWYLEEIEKAIREMGPEFNAKLFSDCCARWLSRAIALKAAIALATPVTSQPWDRWFAESLANQKRYNRELAFVRGVLRS